MREIVRELEMSNETEAIVGSDDQAQEEGKLAGKVLRDLSRGVMEAWEEGE